MNTSPSPTEQLRAEIAAAAARMIAEDGADYGTAKRKAARQILGNARVRGEVMPGNAQIEDEVRIYNEIFFADTQPARLLHLRQLAVELMDELADFNPYLIGAVLNGTANVHSDIHLQLFVESTKDVEIFLMNQNVDFEVSESRGAGSHAAPLEMLSFIWRGEGVHLALSDVDAVRASPKSDPEGRQMRADVRAVRALLAKKEEQ